MTTPADTEPRDDTTRAGEQYRTETGRDALARAGGWYRTENGKGTQAEAGGWYRTETGLAGWLVGWFKRSQLLSTSISFSPLGCDDRAGSI